MAVLFNFQDLSRLLMRNTEFENPLNNLRQVELISKLSKLENYELIKIIAQTLDFATAGFVFCGIERKSCALQYKALRSWI